MLDKLVTLTVARRPVATVLALVVFSMIAGVAVATCDEVDPGHTVAIDRG